MNERIKQLIDQMNKSGLLYQAGDYEMTVTGSDLEYFAELIVQECTKLIEESTEDDEYWSRVTGAESIMAIEEHFGVAEREE
jgi:hypothetical protein